MKRIISIVMCMFMMLVMTACTGNQTKEEKPQEEKEQFYEIAMIADSSKMEDGSFTQVTWQSIKKFADENGLTAKCCKPEESTKEAYLAAVEKAIAKKANIIVMAGSNFETTVYTAQEEYPETYFLLLDGVPHDGNDTYAMAANTIGLIFAEEEAGYLAGYAAVKDGYKKLAFLGGKAFPAVKRYGYGFVQGAAAAAAETETNVEMRFDYTGTFEESETVEKLATGWYKEGTQVIFACGGAMGRSVMKAAEKGTGKVIGVDVDQRYLSETVITSAKKEISTAVEDILKTYVDEKFVGGTAFNYAVKNDGISLEMENAQFNKFTKEEYKKTMKALESGKITLKKDTGVTSVSQLAGEWVTIK